MKRMSIWKLTIPAIEEYLNEQNDSLFADIVIPSGMTKATLVSAILDECDFYNAVYQDANFLKAHITNWFAKYKETFDKWYEIWNASYNPLENYDRRDNISNAKIDTRTTEDKEKEKNTNLHNDGSFSSENGSNIGKVSADDNENFDNKDKDESENSSNRYGMSSDNQKRQKDNNGMSGGSEIERHKEHSHGNIGITTTQRLYGEENALREKYNPYAQITDLFLTEFCIMVL